VYPLALDTSSIVKSVDNTLNNLVEPPANTDTSAFTLAAKQLLSASVAAPE